MEVIITQENFNRGLQIVSRVATTKSSLPILANIYLSAESGQLKLSATDLEIGVITFIGAKVKTEGAITLPARLLVDFVTSNTDATLTFSFKGTEATLRSDRYEAVIHGLDPSEFPPIPAPSAKSNIRVPAMILRRALQDTVFAAAIDDARPVLNGLYLSASERELVLAATDSYRLAEKRLKLAEALNKPMAAILPARVVIELGRILPDSEQEVTLSLAENQLSLEFDQTQVVSRLIEGTFPDYRQIIPVKSATTITAERSQLIAAVRMASLFARDASHQVRLAAKAPEMLRLTAVSSAVGKNQATAPAEVAGDPVEIAFNAKFLLDALNVIHTDTIKLELAGTDRPGVLRPEGETDYLSLVMPLRVDAQ
ncbi:DNA polymerase III subunit beta [Candidatus Berkelbacteria bacterium]|nr:DNA polymerase III subunit beta [Candidatus Berkelbacteria bacterium]